MAGLLDFLQAASNAAASNVSGPVDGLAWLLRKAGLDVGEPVGGSDWMRRQGLTRDVPQSGASLAGETVGLLGPLAGAKAPQVAKGLLQAADNLAAPTTLGNQRGAVYLGKQKIYDHAYHGTESKFNRINFDDAFDNRRNMYLGDAFWMTNGKEHAWSYAMPKGGNKGKVLEGDVFLKNPKVVDAWEEALSTAREVGIPEPKTWPEASEILRYSDWAKDYLRSAANNGHDALIIKRTGDAPIPHDHLSLEDQLADHIAVIKANRVRNIK